jgi:hypothetical protein
MNSFADFFKTVQDNPQIALFIGLALLVLLLLFYMFIRSFFSGAPSSVAQPGAGAPMAVPVDKALAKLQAASQEGNAVLQQLNDALAQKQQQVDLLAKQEGELQAQLKLGLAPAEAVEKKYQAQVAALQAQLARVGRGRFWGGWFTGFLVALVLVAAYVAYLKIGKGLDLAPLVAF